MPKLGLGLGILKSIMSAGPPSGWVQWLKGNVQPDGTIRDARGNLIAKAVEQPAGVSTGSGTLTFSQDIDSVDDFGKAGSGTATINGSNAKQLDLSADTFWDIELTVNGKFVFIADPYTGYDCQGNYDGTPANITVGTQDETAKLQNIGFNRYIRATTNGTVVKIITNASASTDRFYDASAGTWGTNQGSISGGYYTVNLDDGDIVGLITFDSVAKEYWADEWYVPSGSIENHIIPADLSNPGYDVSGGDLRYNPVGILPLGAINFDPESSANTALDIYNTANVLGQAKEYYRTHILTAGIAASGYIHKLRYLRSNSYFRCLGLINLINRLYMKEYMADGDWTAIKQFLNYETELTDAEKARVYSYLKDPTKTNLEEWDEFQDGTVVAAWRFDEPLSLLNNDGQLAKLGWEGEDIPRSLSQTTGSGATIVGDEITLANELAIIKNTSYWVMGRTYVIDCTVEDYVGSGSIVLPYDQTDAPSEAIVTSNGNYVYTYIPDSSTTMIIFSAAGHTAKVTINSIKPIGDLVNTVKDVGSGNGTDTYYDLTQTNMSLQPKRIPGGIDFMDDDHELEHDAALNGKVAYVTEMDGTTGVTFDLAGGKITGALLYSEIVSYKVKSIIIKDT